MENTIIQQGRFTSDGNRKTLAIRSDVDWIKVYNETAIIAGGAGNGAAFYYQRGMDDGRGIVWNKLGADNSTTIEQIAVGAGFTLVNQGKDAIISGANAFNNIGAGTTPQFTVPNPPTTSSLQTGDIVRLSQTEAQRLANDATALLGIDFQITVDDATHFTITNALRTNPGGLATNGSWRRINFDGFYKPKHRFIANITEVANAVVTTTVDHGYSVGQKVRLSVPSSLYGMVEADGKEVTITAVPSASTFTTDLDTSAFTAFKFPTFAEAVGEVYTPAMVVPVGVNQGQAITSGIDSLLDATSNVSIIGVELAAGANSPAGQNTNVIYWSAGKSYSVTNE